MNYDERKTDLAQTMRDTPSLSPPLHKEDIPDKGMTAAENEEDDKDQDEEPSISTRTRSKKVNFKENNKTTDLRNDVIGAYYISLPHTEELTEISIYRVEIPAKHHGRPDVL